MEIRFYDEEHRNKFYGLLSLMCSTDCYHQAAAYLITLDKVCEEHYTDLFDCKKDCIKRSGINKSWQTGTSKKTTRLMYNLWNGTSCSDDADDSGYYAVDEIFCCSYAPYYWQAIQLRYPEYTMRKQLLMAEEVMFRC